jgi:hypothetical protein
MDILGWLWWGLTTLIGLGWSVVWFLLGGWVATLLQLAIVLGVVFSYKYGWKRAPLEMAQRGRTFGRFVWGWMRAREMAEPPPRAARASDDRPGRTSRGRSQREFGDVNLSTLMSVAAIVGLGLLTLG